MLKSFGGYVLETTKKQKNETHNKSSQRNVSQQFISIWYCVHHQNLPLQSGARFYIFIYFSINSFHVLLHPSSTFEDVFVCCAILVRAFLNELKRRSALKHMHVVQVFLSTVANVIHSSEKIPPGSEVNESEIFSQHIRKNGMKNVLVQLNSARLYEFTNNGNQPFAVFG